MSVNVSVFTLTAIAIERYRAIMYPLTHRSSKSRAFYQIVIIWFLSCALATPKAIAMEVIYVQDYDNPLELKPFCDYVSISAANMRNYSHVLLFVQYFFPLFVMSYAYVRMVKCLWGSTTIPGGNKDSSTLNGRKKVNSYTIFNLSLYKVLLFFIVFDNRYLPSIMISRNWCVTVLLNLHNYEIYCFAVILVSTRNFIRCNSQDFYYSRIELKVTYQQAKPLNLFKLDLQFMCQYVFLRIE